MPRRALLPLLLAWPLLAATAQADPETRLRFDAEVARVESQAEAATRRVQAALDAKDFGAWTVAHDAYLQTLAQGAVDIENAMTRLLFGVLAAGGQLDDEDLGAVEDAAALVGEHARRRALAQAWGSLTKGGVRPDRRPAALALLDRQRVYEAGRPSPAAGAAVSPRVVQDVSPFTGRTPTTTEAAQALSKWQYAHMRAQSVNQAITAQELQLASLEPGSTLHQQAEQRLTALRGEKAQLDRAIREWREKYFAAGGT